MSQVFASQHSSLSHADNQRDALRATAHVALLVAAVNVRRERRFAADVQRANPLRRVKLVAGQRKVVRRNLSHINRQLARRLHGVAMVEHATRATDFGNPLDGEQHAGFVVRPHQQEQQSVVSCQ